MLADILVGLIGIAITLIDIYIWVVIIASLITFVNPDPYNPIVQFLYRVTNPAYDLVRRYMRTDFGGLDFAPLVIIIALQVLTVILHAFAKNLAY